MSLGAIFSKMIGLNPSDERISAQDLRSRLDAGEKITLVDVRTPSEFREGYIDGGVNIPLDTLGNAADLPTEGCVVIYCAGGVRSLKAVKIFKARGAKDVVDLEGGIKAWAGSGGNITGR